MFDRRNFLRASGAALTAASYSRVLGANERIGFGIIGTGSRGSYLMREMSKLDDVRWTALCDIYDARLEQAKAKAPDAKAYTDYRELLGQLDAALSAQAKAQLAAEIIFLTHNQQLHEVNLRWHPKAEAALWRPELQEAKRSQTGGHNVRYRTGMKGGLVRELCGLLAEQLPYCRIRYAF